MGAASCKNPKTSDQPTDKKNQKSMTIGVFGLHNAGKTSAIKAIEGDPKKDVNPTIGSTSSTVANPMIGADHGINTEMIKIIDVSGEKKFREQSWAQYYNQIHGLIFVIDGSERRQVKENKQVLEELLANEALKSKPVLILLNKKDLPGSTDDEDEIKDKLQIEKLKIKYKIEFCTALPQNRTKVDQSIRQGFSWLIRAIEADYTRLNARVKPSNNNPKSKELERRNPRNERTNRADSDEDDSEPTFSKRRTNSPMSKDKDKNWMKTSMKLPNLGVSKSKPGNRNGHETYSENDDDDDGVVTRSRPNVPRIDLHKLDTSGSGHQLGDLNKKKKIVGLGGSNRDGMSEFPPKRSTDFNAKSFRSSFETLPEEAPWSSSATKPAKSDSLLVKPYGKPPFSTDSSKRDRSPLTRDTKLPALGSFSKHENFSDDENDNSFTRAQKAKPALSSNNRLKDNYDDYKKSPSASASRVSSAVKKPTSGIYGDDDDDYRSKDFKKPVLPAASKTGKSYGSDEEDNKSYLRTSDRFNPTNDYRGTATGATPARSKFNDNSLALSSTKPLTSLKENNDDYLSKLSKPGSLPRFNDDKRPSSAAKPSGTGKFNDDDDDDWRHSPTKPATRLKPFGDDYGSPSKPLTASKFNTDSYSSATSKPKTGSKFDDDYSTSPKLGARPKYGDSLDDRPSSSSKLGIPVKPIESSRSALSTKPLSYSKFGDDDDDDDKYGSSTKLAAGRSAYDSKGRVSSPIKPANRSKFDDDDDDDYGKSSKPAARSKFNDDDYSSPTRKPATSYSKFDDDKSSTKPAATRSSYESKDRLSSASKPAGRSKYDDDDDDYPSSKVPSRSKYDDDDDKYGSSSKPAASRSKFDDDDDDYRSSKAPTRSKFDDDDDLYGSPPKSTAARSNYGSNDRSSSSSKPVSRSKYDDDDDDSYSPSSSKRNLGLDSTKSTAFPKKTDSSSRYDDYGGGSGGARSRYDDDDFGSSKTGSGGARAVSTSNTRQRRNFDDDDDL